MPWARMVEITGLSLGAIERGTRAVGNTASRENRRACAARTAQARRGEKKPWLSEQLRQAWEAGSFDFHRGRIRSQVERTVLRLAAQRPDVKEHRHEAALRRWQRPDERARLLAYHQAEDVRRERSRAQTKRMQEHPEKWCRGRGAYVDTVKCVTPRIWTRSSYERVVVGLLDADPDVVAYEYECRVELPDGRWILPDFVVQHRDGSVTLLEVKASWVLGLPPGHKVSRRLHDASSFAASMGWVFIVWTEKDFGDARRNSTGQDSQGVPQRSAAREVRVPTGGSGLEAC